MRNGLRTILLLLVIFHFEGCKQSHQSSIPHIDVLATDTSLVWIYLYEDDTLFRLWSIAVGNKGEIADGLYTIYLDSSKTRKVYQGTVMNNKKIGTHTFWRTNGTIRSECSYSTGHMINNCQSWTIDGKLKSISEYSNGVIIHHEKYYLIDSVDWVKRESIYSNGKIYKEIVTDGQGNIPELDFYKKDNLSSTSRLYLSIEFDSLGFVTNSWRYDLDTISAENESQEIWIVGVEIDSLVYKN